METYYLNQAGTGLPLQIFAGTRYQRGNGFFGRFFMSKIMPILRYLGEQALSTGQAILSDTKKSAKDRLKIKNEDGKDIVNPDWSKIRAANNLMHSMIKQIDLKIGNKEMSSVSNTYAYRAYFENLLGFSKDAKETHLSTGFWSEKDDIISNFVPETTNKDPSQSKIVDMYGKLHLDLTFQGKALLGGCDIKIKLILNNPEFCFIYPKSVNIIPIIKDASVYIHRLKAKPMLVNAHSRALQTASSRYPITRVEVKHVPIPSGSMDAMLDNVIIGQLPRRMFLACVKNTALNGAKDEDPFKFNHYDVNYLACYLDGIQYPTNAYQPNFDQNLFVREYSGLFQAMNMNSTESTIDIKRNDYANGKTIYGFNFAPDLSHGCGLVGHVNPANRGTLRVYLRFKKALPEVIDVVLFCEYDNMIEIDKERNVSCDFI
ncbi:uncharacterized protein F54H12.2-like [Panonychus citri]|uniref:uncharacterized protein F54H12.2-like n=1 Tax=Panonychus citri TaxID=50023 RepID=UPI0023083214|nr:uncharacterized protein F54H12.2-like [Panonychus citri]XP_053205712.1 uncharacterized protein F54H12.2-like [Panonychus citri]XP_053210217.1 uncharacterized protein F54H12.2-like [Panonychus citri]